MDTFCIAAVIVTYNRSQMLFQNMASLLAQGKNITIFVIDNDSSDNTYEIVQHFSSDKSNAIIYHNTQANLGGSGGFAVGCRLAFSHATQFTHFWLSDDDITFYPDCLKQLQPYLDQRTLLQPMRYDQAGNNAEASTLKIDLKSIFILNHKRQAVMETTMKHATSPFPLENIPFEGVMVPRAVIEKIGVPDKRFFIFGDDLDFCLKALKHDFQIRCIPTAKITRLKCDRAPRVPGCWKSYFVYRNFFYIQKNYGNNFFVRHRPYLLAALVAGYCFLKGNRKGLKVIKDALRDGMDDAFPITTDYIPS